MQIVYISVTDRVNLAFQILWDTLQPGDLLVAICRFPMLGKPLFSTEDLKYGTASNTGSTLYLVLPLGPRISGLRCLDLSSLFKDPVH